MPNLKLYQYEACPFCSKVRAFLRYKRIAFEAIEVSPLNKKEIAFSKDYKKVPILIDDEGRQVNDSTAIMQYLDQRFPNRPVFSKQPDLQDRQKIWLEWSEKLVKALPPVIYESLPKAWKAFSYISCVAKFSCYERWAARLLGTLIMWRVGKKRAIQMGVKSPMHNLRSLLDELSEEVKKGYLSGMDHPGAADLAVWGFLDCVRILPVFEEVRRRESLLSWFQRLEFEISDTKRCFTKVKSES